MRSFLYPLAHVAVWPAVVGMPLAGPPGAVRNAGFMTVFQRAADCAFRGVYEAMGAVQGAARS